jgi:hypothetical protein
VRSVVVVWGCRKYSGINQLSVVACRGRTCRGGACRGRACRGRACRGEACRGKTCRGRTQIVVGELVASVSVIVVMNVL